MKEYSLLSSTNFSWSTLEYFVPFNSMNVWTAGLRDPTSLSDSRRPLVEIRKIEYSDMHSTSLAVCSTVTQIWHFGRQVAY